MSIKVNFNVQQGAAVKTLVVNAKANKALVTSLPNESVWIEFIDEETGIAPKRMVAKRHGNDLWLSFDEENEPELIITDYYLGEEPAALLGLGSDGAYHAYVSELATSQLSVQQLASNTLTPVILAQESVSLAPFFASWGGLLKGIGAALGAGLVAAVASGGGSGGGQGKAEKPQTPDTGTTGMEEKPVAGVKFIPQEAGNGGLQFEIPSEAQKVVLKVVPAGKTQPVEIVLVKQGDKFVVDGDSPVKLDIEGNKVSIAEDQVKDNSNVSAVVFNGENKASEPVNAKTGYDKTTNEHAKDVATTDEEKLKIAAKVKESMDTSSPLDQDPETFVIEGYTAKGATVTVTDSKGNVLGSTTADPQTGFYNFTVTQGKDNVKVGDNLTVTTKLDGYAPSTEEVTVSAVTRHTGDAVGPEKSPTVEVKNDNVEIKTNFDGKGEGEKVAEVAVKYTDLEGKEQEVTYTYDPEKNQLTSSDPSKLPNIPLSEGQDPNTITIPREKLPADSVIEAVSKDLAGNPSEPAKAKITPKAEDSTLPEVTPEAQDNGDVEIPLPKEDNVKSLIVTFEKQPTTPADDSVPNSPQAQPETVSLKLVKDEDGNWKVDETDPEYPNSNTNKDLITITDGKVTIPANNVADGSIVTATPVNDQGLNGVTSQTEAKPDESAVTPAPKFTQLIAINDTNPAAEEATRLKFTIKTEPNATVEVFNQAGKLIAKGKANEQGIFEKEIGESDSKELVSGETLTAKATAPNKRPSTDAAKLVGENNQETDAVIPKVTEFTETAAPNAPTIEIGKAGNTPIKVTPTEPLEEGDILSIVVPNTTGKEETLAFKVVDGKLTPVENTGEPALVKYKLNGNTVEIDRTSVAPNAPITANTKDIANNLSGMVTDNTGFTAQTEQPKVTSITSKDNSKEADDNPEIFTLEGEAPVGSVVKVYDKNGNLLGTSEKVGDDGKFTLSNIVEHQDCDMKVGDQFTVVAQKVDESGKPTEAESQLIQTTVTAPAAGEAGHTDNIAPALATLAVKPNGDLSVELPKQAVKGDSVEVVVKDNNGNEIGNATLTSDGQGNWTSSNPSLIPNVAAADNNTATIPSANVPDGAKVSATSQDLAGNKAEPTNLDVTKPTEPSDSNPPAKPEITAQEDGSRVVEIPKDATSATLTVKPAGDEPEKTVEVERGEDGKLKIKDGTNTDPAMTVSEDGNSLIIPKELAKPNTEISAVAKGSEGQSSEPATDTVKDKTATPTVDADSVKFIDTSKPADTQADEVRLTGKVEGEPAGTKVSLKDAEGNILGEGVTKEDGTFEIVGKVDADKPLNKDSLLTVVAKAEGKDPSDKATGDHLKVQDVPATAEGHPNDAEGPSAPVLASEPGTGAVLVKFPTDANAGDKVVVKFADEIQEGDNPTPNKEITYTRQPDGTWTADPSGVLPDIVDNTDEPSVLIPENLIKDGSQVKAESVDGIIPDAKKESNVIIAGNDAKTPAPAEVNIQAIDKNAQADIEPDAIKVSGKVSEPVVAGTEIIVYKDGTEIGRTKIKDNDGTFELEIPENERDFKVDDLISVVAKEPTKAASDAVQKPVPELRANAEDHPNDNTKPEAPTVDAVKGTDDQHEKGDGRVMVSVPENNDNPYVVGDKLEITYVPEGESDEEVKVTLERQADGSWKSEDEAIVPSIPAGQNSTTISEDIIKDGREVKARVVDVAGNASDESDTSKTTAPFDDAAAKPTITGIVASDVTPKSTQPTDTAKPDNNPEKVELTGELKGSDNQPIANAVIEVRDENGNVLGKAKTDSEGKYSVTLEEVTGSEQPSTNEDTGLNKVGADALTANGKLKVVAKVNGQEESAPADATIPEVLTLSLDENPITGINLDEKSNETPEQFEIKGTATAGSIVKAYIKVGEKLVEIGSTEQPVPADGKFTLTTKSLEDIKKLDGAADFDKFRYAEGDKTDIILQAVPTDENKATKSPSPQESVSAVKVERGLEDNAENKDKLHPNDKDKVNVVAEPTALPDGFGGAKVQLPDTTNEDFLEVILTYTPKKTPATGEGQPTEGATQPTETVKLTWDGKNWTSSNPDVIPNSAIKTTEGTAGAPAKTVVTLAGDKVADKSTLKAQVQDYAGNKSEEKSVELNSAAKDEIPERTDVPHLTAGRYEPETGVDGDKPNAGDIVAKPGGDNDKMVVKFIDKDGQPKEIVVKKDLEQGKWVLDDATSAAEGDYIIKDDGTVIVKGPSIKDYSPVEAVGYKTVGTESVPSDKPYEKEGETATDETGQKVKTVDREVVYALGDDETPAETDPPQLTKGEDGTEHQGAAFIQPGKDNTEVVVNFKGYVVQQPTESGEAATTSTTPVISTAKLDAPTVVGDTAEAGADSKPQPQESENVLVARKEQGVWKLYATTKADYDTPYEENGQQLKGKFLTEVSSDIATVDENGKILLKEAAIRDNTDVSATGFNATRQPAEGKAGDQTITVGNALAPDADVTADPPTITQLTDGKVSVAPGNDNKTVTITYDKPNDQKGTITIEKVDIPEATTENGQPKPTKWVIKQGDNGNTTPEGITVDPNTGTVIIPKEQLKVGGTVEAMGTDSAQKPNTAKSEPITVVEDSTPNSADSATSGLNGDKPTYKPGGDSKEMEFFKHPPVNDDEYSENPTPTTEPESLGKIVKGEDGKWKWEGDKKPEGATLNEDTGEVTFPSGGGLSNGEGISATTTDKNGNTSSTEPVVPPKADSSANTADTPTVTPIKSGEGQGGVKILPGKASETAESDNTSITVSFVKEPKPTEGGSATTEEPSADALAQEPTDTVITAVKVGNTWKFDTDVDPLVASINPVTGEITLEAGAVKDGTTVKAVAKDILGNTSTESTGIVPDNPGKVSEANQPTVPEVPKEPETTEPQPPAQPELIDDTTTITPADETPTTFKNTGIGQVEITPGAGVDFISFTVTTQDGGEQNIAFIKDGNGWEKYVMQLGDGNGNDIVDGNEKVIYDNVQTIGNGPLTVSGITSDSITNILVGKAGDEFLQPFARPTDNRDDWAVQGGVTEDKVHSFKVKQNPKDAVPERIDVLSDGGKLEAPTVQPIIDENGKYSLKITADPTKIHSMSFDLDIPEGGDYTFYIYQSGGRWVPVVNGDYFHKYVVSATAENPNVFFIRDAEGKPLAINDPTNNPSDENIVREFIYGSRNNLENTEIDKFHSVADNTWTTENKAIKLSPITITSDTAQEGNAGGSPSTPSTGDNGSGTGDSEPVAPTPTPPAKPVVGNPTADKGEQQGSVKVKPGDNTDAFRVDYQQPNGTNRTVWFKKENGTWKVDPTKHPESNKVDVSDNSPIKLNSSTGEVTLAPSEVKDGSKVTITSLTAEGALIAGKQASFTAEAEPQPVQPLAQRDESNKGGAWVQPQDNTNKFKVSYYSDSGRRKYDLVYEKQDGKWKLSETSKVQLDKDKVSDNLRPKLEESTGKVTLHPDAVLDKSYVTVSAYNNEGGTVSNKVQTDTDTINYHPLISNNNAQSTKPSGRIGQEHWRHNRDVYMNEHGKPSNALEDTTYGKFNNSKAIDVDTLYNSEGRSTGRRYSWGEGDDVVGTVDSIGRLSEDSGHYDKLELRFNGGNDLLAIGNDLGTKFPSTATAYRKGNEKLIDLDMGTGNDVVIVGDDNDWLKVMRNKKTGLLDIFNYATQSNDEWQELPGSKQQQWTLNQQNGYGGKIMNTILNMGEGDDTLLVQGKTSNEAAIQASTINLGNGINHLIVGLNGTDSYAAMQVRSAVESSDIIGGSGADHITAPLFQNYAKLDLKGGNDVVKTNRILNTQVDTGAGDDIMEVQKYAINGQPSMRHDTEIGAGTKVNLGEGNDTFLQGSNWIADGAEILGGRGIDLYRLSGNAKADSGKVKGFERIEFTGNEQLFSLKYSDLLNSGVEGPIKIFSSQAAETNSKVDFGGNSNHWLSNTNGQDSSGGYYDGDNNKTWKSKGTVKDGNDTYTVYTYDNDSRYEVWIENGITVI